MTKGYEEYEKKIQRIADALGWIKRHRIWMVCAFAVLVLLAIAFFGTRGIIVRDLQIPAQSAYGESLHYSAKTLFGSEYRVEYSTLEGDVWKSAPPVLPGTYKARIVSSRMFGMKSYGAEKSFTISKRLLNIVISDTSPIYGEEPVPTVSNLAYRDFVAEISISVSDYAASEEICAELESIRIEDQYGNDRSDAYEFVFSKTVLTPSPRPISVIAGDAQKVYDGTPLSCSEYTLVAGSLLPDHILSVSSAQSAVHVGVAENRLTFTVKDESGNDLTHCYTFACIPGTLTVLPRPLTLATGSSSKVYDGMPFSCREYTILDGTLAPGERLDIMSYATVTEAGEHDNQIDFSVLDADGVSVTANYYVSVVPGILSVGRRPLSVAPQNEKKEYDAIPLAPTAYISDGLIEGHRFSEGAFSFAGSQTDVGKSASDIAKTVMYQILDASGRDVTANYLEPTLMSGKLEVYPRTVVVRVTDRTKEYDTQPLCPNEYSSSGLIAGHHFAADAFSYHGSQTEIGSSLARICKTGNYRIVDQNGGAVTDNYVLEFQDGTLTVTKRRLLVRACNAQKVYDDTPLTESRYEIVRGSVLDFCDHRLSCTVAGSITDVGEMANTITACGVYRGTTDVTQYYEIQLESGILKITPRPITFSFGEVNAEYDGTEKNCDVYWISSPKGSLLSHHQALVNFGIGLIEVGQKRVEADVSVFSSEDKNVTSNYQIELNLPFICVQKRTLYISAGSFARKYDGTPLTLHEYYITQNSLVAGHHIDQERLVYVGSQTDVGTSANAIKPSSVFILDENGNDVTEYYSIVLSEGTLTVLKAD